MWFLPLSGMILKSLSARRGACPARSQAYSPRQPMNWVDGRMGETEGIARAGRYGNDVYHCRLQGVASAHYLTAAPLFIAEAPRVGPASFGAEEGFRADARRLFLTMLIALRRRGSSKNSLKTARKIKRNCSQ